MRKKREPISPLEALRKLAQAGVQDSPRPTRHIDQDLDELPSLESRISCLLGIANETSRPTTNMIFFTMYDIESNKVRRLIAKYLISKGCTRIQDSIFLADLPRPTYEEIKREPRRGAVTLRQSRQHHRLSHLYGPAPRHARHRGASGCRHHHSQGQYPLLLTLIG